MEFLKSAVATAIAKGSSFPYSIGDRVPIDGSIWTLHDAIKREDNSDCSIFTFDIAANKSRLPLAKNAVRKLRTLRHPGVLKFLDTIETDTQIYVVTERVKPLSWPIKLRQIKEETAKWGLYTVASTLKFINEDAASVHGAVRLSSIFTSESGEWKLGGLEILSSMKEDDAVIYTYGSLMPDSAPFTPPEVVKGGWETIKRNPLSAVDAYGFGILVFEAFNGKFKAADQAGSTPNIPPSMQQSYKRLMNPNPKPRLSVAHFLEQGSRNGGFFETPLIRLTQDIESLGLKSQQEKDEVISQLDDLWDDQSGELDNLQGFPEEYFTMKVLPELLKSVEFGGGGPKVLSIVLKIGAKLTEEEYASKLTPVIVRLFGNPDRVIRVCLLDNLPLMIDHLSQRDVNDKIFPQLTTGFTDLAPVVREQTVKAVLTVVNKLSDRSINGDLLRYLAKTANDEQPGIRTNTTICLGKIGKYLGPNSRTKVLIAAFSRSLRDPFVHARNAGLMALGVTLDLFTEEDCATKILPAICPVLLDKEKLVRDQANKTVDTCLQRIRKHSTTMPDTVLPPTEAAPARITTPAPNGSSPSWAGWAISSFTNKPTSAKGEIQPQHQPKPQKPAHTPTLSSTSSGPRSASMPRPKLSSAPSKTDAPQITRSYSEQPVEEYKDEDGNEDVFDAWAAMDDDNEGTTTEGKKSEDEEDNFFDAKPSPLPAASPSVPFDDGGEPDFAGWLAAQSKAKTKKPLPKGLGSNRTASPGTMSPPSTARSTTSTSSKTTRPKAATQPAKTIDTKPKEESIDDDDWDIAWD